MCIGVKDARTALHAASTNGHLNVVEFLLDNGASVNSMDGVRQCTVCDVIVRMCAWCSSITYFVFDLPPLSGGTDSSTRSSFSGPS